MERQKCSNVYTFFTSTLKEITALGCDFFERRGEKGIDIRRFLGYVCQIAKVRVRMSFGWVSLFAQKGGCYMAQ